MASRLLTAGIAALRQPEKPETLGELFLRYWRRPQWPPPLGLGIKPSKDLVDAARLPQKAWEIRHWQAWAALLEKEGGHLAEEVQRFRESVADGTPMFKRPRGRPRKVRLAIADQQSRGRPARSAAEALELRELLEFFERIQAKTGQSRASLIREAVEFSIKTGAIRPRDRKTEEGRLRSQLSATAKTMGVSKKATRKGTK